MPEARRGASDEAVGDVRSGHLPGGFDPLTGLPLRARSPSNVPVGTARPRRVFVPAPAPSQPTIEEVQVMAPEPTTLASATIQMPTTTLTKASLPMAATMLTKATIPGLPRVAPGRLPGSIGPMSLDAEQRHPPSRAPGPVMEVRRSGRSSRGLAMDRLTEALPGRLVAGRYRVDELLGRGAMGVIFSAEDTSPSAIATRVALKVLDPEIAHDPAAIGRFRSEALAPQQIASDHVVRIFDADVCRDLLESLTGPEDDSMIAPGPSEGVPFIVMEMLYGQDLRAHLHERGPFRARELLLLLRQVAVTLDKAHALGIVHRDLKPANLFLTRAPDGSQLVKILDFGVAQLARRREPELLPGSEQADAADDWAPGPSPALSASGIQEAGLFGTPWYMAPEQVNGEPAVPGTDGWALALIAFRLLTGESYWAPAPLPELLGEIVAGPQAAPSSVVRERGLIPHASLGKAFDAWFFRACALDPSDRFPTATSEIEALSSALASDQSA